MESQSTISQLKNNDLMDELLNKGILQEVNRTFFNPLGLSLELDLESYKLELFKTDDPKGFLYDRLNKFNMQAFKDYANLKYTQRSELVGFVIQCTDLLKVNKLLSNKESKLNINPKTKKVTYILQLLNNFCYLMYKRFMEVHNNKDDNFSKEQFNSLYLKNKLFESMAEDNWVDAANYCLLLSKYEDLANYMEKLQEENIEYQRLTNEEIN